MSETLVNQIDNKNIYASRAVADEDGTNIKTSYALKSEIPTVPTMKDLVAGTNVSITETANGIEVSAGAVDQTYDALSQNAQSGVAVASAISGKQDTLTAGANISIDANNEISATDTTYTAGTGIAITNNVISIGITPEALNETSMLQSTPAGITFSIQATKFGRLMLVSGAFDRRGTAATTGQDYLIGTVKSEYRPARVAYTTFGVYNVAATVQGRVRIDLDGNIYVSQNSTSGNGSRVFQLAYILDSST